VQVNSEDESVSENCDIFFNACPPEFSCAYEGLAFLTCRDNSGSFTWNNKFNSFIYLD
jgi:hypothetical protein